MSQESSNVTALRNWFRTCPAISSSNRFRIDYLAENPTEYSIYAVPSTLKYHENILGNEVLDDIQTQNFIFASKESYGADIQQNLANLGFYDEIVAWILEQNLARNFPEWTLEVSDCENVHIKSIVPTLTAYVAQGGSDAAKYQIQLKITYRRN
ncbi:MAG: hypothetical protein LIP12_00255 [Clostridiales bacterium]|nr:hypothetical protein [Clostridiales bacterium]